MKSSFFEQERRHGIVDESATSSDASSVVSSECDLFGEVNYSGSSSPTSPSSVSNSSSGGQLVNGLQDMSSLLQELPFKRGLSKHYNGKSQSFTSLANVKCLEDLAKPRNPYNNKRLKSCKSHALVFESQKSTHDYQPQTSTTSTSSRLLISDKASSRSIRPPIPQPHKSTCTSSFANHTPLFA